MEEVVRHSKSRTQTLQAHGVVRGHCAMKPEERIEEGGKKTLAHNRVVQVVVHGYGDNDVHLVRAIGATRNPKLAGTREVVTKYISESEGMQISGGCLRATRRHVGTIGMIYGVKRKDFKKMGILLAAAEIFVPDMTHLKRCGFFGGVVSKRERLSRAKKKDSVYPIGDGNKIKKPGARTKKGCIRRAPCF